ncbi:hypothetical protein Trydic_g19265 [Trypoxylus dichotomus]
MLGRGHASPKTENSPGNVIGGRETKISGCVKISSGRLSSSRPFLDKSSRAVAARGATNLDPRRKAAPSNAEIFLTKIEVRVKMMSPFVVKMAATDLTKDQIRHRRNKPKYQ